MLADLSKTQYVSNTDTYSTLHLLVMYVHVLSIQIMQRSVPDLYSAILVVQVLSIQITLRSVHDSYSAILVVSPRSLRTTDMSYIQSFILVSFLLELDGGMSQHL